MSDTDRPARGNRKENTDTTKAHERTTKHEETTDHACHASDEHLKFDQAMDNAAKAAENAGRSAARNFLGGALYGIGKKAGQELWELVTGSGASN